MRIFIATFIVFCALTMAPFYYNSAAANSLPSPEHPSSFADLVEKLLPAVVNISSTQKPIDTEDFPEMPHFPPGSPFEDFFEDFMSRRGHGMPTVPAASLGSGFIIDAENGYVVTNNHVVKDADEVRVTLHNDITLEAEVIGRDEKTDLAVLKVDPKEADLVEVPLGHSEVMRVGDWILAIGNPFGLGGTVTAGIVSAQQRNINAGPYDDFIQTDASINRGNSGGPMFDLKGEVIGINTAIFSPSGGSVGIGFAIPINLARPVIMQLIDYGHTRRGWLGVRIQSVTDEIAESLGLEEAHGALVASVTPTGPAEEAGLKAGDIILEFNGHAINEMRDLPRLVAETKIDTDTDVVYWRDGKRNEVKVLLGELEKAEEEGLVATGPRSESDSDSGEGMEIESVGMSIAALTDASRDTYEIENNLEGVLVVSVEMGGEADVKGISEGDVIVEVNQQAVSTPDEILDVISKAEDAGRSTVLLLVNNQGDVRFVALRLNN